MKRARKTFRKYFVPHEENDHRPHLLRPATVAFVCLIAVAVELFFLASNTYLTPRSRLFGTIVVNALIDGTNAARTLNGVAPLHENALLDAAALAKANDMVKNDYFAHTSPSGITPWYWFVGAGYDFTAAGENLAVDFTDSSDVTNAWMNSPDHRANILNAGFKDIGMAAAQGEFQGHSAIYVVELFGTPAAAPIAAAAGASAHIAAAAPARAVPNVPLVVATNTPAAPASEPVFVAVAGAQTGTVAAAPAGSAAPVIRAANPVQTLASDPRRIVDYLYLAIALVFAFALLINFFAKLHLRHPQLIMGGMIVILLAGLLITMNQHLAGPAITIL